MPVRVQTLRSTVKGQRPAAGSREVGELYVNYPDLQFGIIDTGKAARDLLPIRFFSVNADYAGGDFVINSGVAYKAKGPITAGAFNPTQWDTLSTSVDLSGKENTIAPGTTGQYWRGDKTWQTLDKAAVGLANVDNTADANKPVSTAQAAALALKANLIGPTTFSGAISAPTAPGTTNDTTVATTAFVKGQVATSDAAQATALSLKADIASPTFTGDPRAPTPPPADNDTSIATTAYVQTAMVAGGYITDAPNDGLTYGRKNQTWATVIGGAAIGDVPPVGPLVPGQLWWESDSGGFFIYYSDPNGSQWVQLNNAPTIAGTAESRNRIVNPAMTIFQEGIIAVTASGAYICDQWTSYHVSSAGVFTKTTAGLANYTINGNVRAVRVTITTPDAALAAGEYLNIAQPIEGVRMKDFMWGYPTARQIVVRFGFRGPAGTYAMAITNGPSEARAYVAPFTISAGQANTEVTQTFVVPGDTSGTWLSDTSLGAYFYVVLAAGTTFQGVAGWQAGPKYATAAISNGMATGGAVFELTDAGLYLDRNNTGLPPPWQMPDEAQELAACQRYWQQASSIWGGYAASASAYGVTFSWPVKARTSSPALSGIPIGGVTGFANTVGTFGVLSAQSNYETRTANATVNGGTYATTVTVNSRM